VTCDLTLMIMFTLMSINDMVDMQMIDIKLVAQHPRRCCVPRPRFRWFHHHHVCVCFALSLLLSLSLFLPCADALSLFASSRCSLASSSTTIAKGPDAGGGCAMMLMIMLVIVMMIVVILMACGLTISIILSILKRNKGDG